jgi:hypothetical protein
MTGKEKPNVIASHSGSEGDPEGAAISYYEEIFTGTVGAGL